MHVYYSHTHTQVWACLKSRENAPAAVLTVKKKQKTDIPKPQSRFHLLFQGISLYKGGCIFLWTQSEINILGTRKEGTFTCELYNKSSGNINELWMCGSFCTNKRHLIGAVCESCPGAGLGFKALSSLKDPCLCRVHAAYLHVAL